MAELGYEQSLAIYVNRIDLTLSRDICMLKKSNKMTTILSENLK